MKKHWKLMVTTALVLGVGYLAFCLVYDVYEGNRRSLPEKNLRARLDRIERAVDTFVAGADSEIPPGVRMLFREWQSWETGGGRSRLTLWADGRSEVRVWPCSYDSADYMLQIESGWRQSEDAGSTVLVRDAVFAEAETQKRFRNAFKLGIHLLVPVKKDYVDGGGLVIGIQTNGVLNKQVFPEFSPEHWETVNYVRFKALCRLLGEFDVTKGYRIVRREETANQVPEDTTRKLADPQR